MTPESSNQIHVSYVKRETFGCIVQNMIECLLASPEDRDFYVTACKIISGRKDQKVFRVKGRRKSLLGGGQV